MSAQLFKRLTAKAKSQERTLKAQTCELNENPTAKTTSGSKQVAPIHPSGPMSLIHPGYRSRTITYPLLIAQDLLDRFEPLIDFKQLNA